jgi:peptidoglycan/xylan/chitin deacetylase (PgdA/CDA1 family)
MGHEGTFVVSLDFELNWGVRDQVSIDRYGSNLRGAREVIPRLLERFEAHGVRATWATVGMLFCESKEELLACLPERRPAYAQAQLSPYPHIASVGKDERADPLHFAPSLVRRIAATDGQEVATHTFSHFYCLEPGQTEADFEADLRAAVAVARTAGIELRSIVFPRNQVNPAYLPICARLGLVAYRGNPGGRVHSARGESSETPLRRAGRLFDAYAPLPRGRGSAPRAPGTGGLVDVPASRFLRPRPRSKALAVLEPRKVARVLGEMERAARAGAVYHLWWHPHNFGVDQDLHLAQLDAVLQRFARLREEGAMRSLTMAELAEEQRAS